MRLQKEGHAVATIKDSETENHAIPISELDTTKVIRTERIELVDSEGRVRVRIGPDKPNRHYPAEDYFTIEMFAPDGERAVMIRTTPGGGAILDLGRHEIGEAHLEAGSGGPFYEHGSKFILNGGNSLGSRYGIWVDEGCTPRIENSGPMVHFGNRPASRDQLIAALPVAKRNVDNWESDGDVSSRGAATTARRHVREFCAEFDVDAPEWATDAFARRLRKISVAS